MDIFELRERRAHFEARAAQYRGFGYNRDAAADFVAGQVGTLRGRVLDVGTGRGLLAMALARAGLLVTSVDVDAEEQALAAWLAADAQLTANIDFARADASALPYPDEWFAGCATMDVLHHLEDGATALTEVIRVLQPGGLFVVSDFTPEGFDMVAQLLAREGTTHSVGPVTQSWAEGFLTGSGLEGVGTAEGHLHRVSVFKKPPARQGPSADPQGDTVFAGMDRQGLLRALEVMAKNWLALDGCWFLGAEERFGLETAIELDSRAWERYSGVEARRIMAAFDIPEGGGLESLERVLRLRAYALVNPQRFEWSADRTRLRFFMESCRVQEARQRKGLPAFPCKPVGMVEFHGLAAAVDARIRVQCLHCPPDPCQVTCAWEFTLEGD